MYRVVALAALALLAAAPSAAAGSIALRDDVRAAGVALAGPEVITMRERRDGSTQLVAQPRTGGKARSVLTVADAQSVYEARRELYRPPPHAWR